MKFLIIEDEHKIANSIKKGLEQENFVVDVVYDGVEGFDLALDEEYDAIILDLMLPGIDGISICKNLRNAGKHTPILILTAKGELENKVEGLNSGADDYLVKPFAFDELLARLHAISRRPKNTNEEKLSAKDLVINTGTLEAEKSGKQINLSKKEYAILEYLLRNKGKLISKDRIISHVWNYDSDILPNTVEVFIGSLRNKIGDDIIKTKRGFGYKIDV